MPPFDDTNNTSSNGGDPEPQSSTFNGGPDDLGLELALDEAKNEVDQLEAIARWSAAQKADGWAARDIEYEAQKAGDVREVSRKKVQQAVEHGYDLWVGIQYEKDLRDLNERLQRGISSFPKNAKGSGPHGHDALAISTAVEVSPNKSKDAGFPKLDDAALHGLAGDIVRKIAPNTESDPVAILVQVLAYFGNVIGRTAHYKVESDRHGGNLFIALVGDTAKARKGTSGSRVREVFARAESNCSDWLGRIKSGLSSGEGLINEVRDPTRKWNSKEKAHEEIDPGVTDKRLLIVESEFASTLSVMDRPGNTLSPILRNAWDGRTLETLTKNSPLKATNPHVSIIAHITDNEL